MFSYYGSKSKIVKKYPEPIYDTIIEPFAGAANYSLLHCDKDVLLNDLYKDLINIWRFIINCTEDQILSLPEIKWNTNIQKLGVSKTIKDLLGFTCNMGRGSPSEYPTTWALDNDVIPRLKRKLHRFLGKLSHWQLSSVDYTLLDNVEATWFIDPPYIVGGEGYVHNDIDYHDLGRWCKSRKGQVIVCENGNADWLDFKPLTLSQGFSNANRKQEVIWTNQTSHEPTGIIPGTLV